jgi:hypothetical protein
VAQRVHVRRFRRPVGQTLLGEERWEERQRRMVIAKGRAIPESIMDVPVLFVRVRRARDDGDAPLTESERAELTRSRRENAELAMERDVLRVAPPLGQRGDSR